MPDTRKFYPIFLDITGRRAVVAGGGPVAARKAGSLADAGADVTVISPALCPQMSALVSDGRARHVARVYRKGDLADASVVVAATDDPAVNEAVCADAKDAGALVNCVRPPDVGDFVVPSTIRRGGLTVAVSTSGGCPALTKKLRRDIEAFLGDEYGAYLEFLEEARGIIKESVPDEAVRQAILTRLVESDLSVSFRTDGTDAAHNKGRDMLATLIAGGA
ncbi:MAG: bifunctional precorrin-2 dehydrogenase/sirohydrochlorin ferrochelatase [Nitrospirae bacterium]|nr:bifunctional precorrin-2 dehydrogenase/sirohydrochlorin ferrochelatase [Nitrospirota bacterium]